MFVIFENGMLEDSCKSYSLFAIKDENAFKEIFQIRCYFFNFFLFLNCIWKVKVWSASSRDFGLHVMALERVFSKKHEVEKDSHCPNVNRNSVIRVANNLRSHVFLCSTMSFCPDSSYWPCESEVSNFVTNISLSSWTFGEQHIFTFDISMNKISFVNAFKPFHNFHHDFNCLLDGKCLTGHFCLVS